MNGSAHTHAHACASGYVGGGGGQACACERASERDGCVAVWICGEAKGAWAQVCVGAVAQPGNDVNHSFVGTFSDRTKTKIKIPDPWGRLPAHARNTRHPTPHNHTTLCAPA